MTTTVISITPSDGWVSLSTATANTTVSIEKKTGGSAAVLAIDTVTPVITTGHSIENQKLKNAVLKTGESVYALCTDELSVDDVNVFVITG